VKPEKDGFPPVVTDGAETATLARDVSREIHLRREERLRERTRIARELHDTLFQGFLGASMRLERAVEQLPDDSPNRHSLDGALQLIRRVIDEGRDVLHGLRSSPGAATSLEERICAINEEFPPSRGVSLRVFARGHARSFDPGALEQTYLIAREAVVNAIRHSGATDIEVEVDYTGRRVRVVVRDNGCGIRPSGGQDRRHMGIVGMRERAAAVGGKLRIWSGCGAGTEVEITISQHTIAHACA